MSSIQLAFRYIYVSWQFKSTSTNTILEYYVVYVVLSYLLFLCIFYLFSKSYSMKTLQKHILVLFGLYNPETLNCFWTVEFHQSFGRLVEF